MPPAFDHEELMDRIDGDLEFLEESIEIFDEDAAPLLERIREAVAGHDAGGLATSAHTLKSMVANFCSAGAERAARDIEMRGRENRLEGVDALLEPLSGEISRLRAELQAFLEAQRA